MTSKIGVKKIQYPNGTDILTLDSSGSLAIASNLSVDTNTLHVDASNNRVGIGTASPAESFVVHGTGSTTVTRIKSPTQTSVYQRFDNTTSNTGYVGYNGTSLELWANNNLGLAIDSTGAVTKPLQSAFNAVLSGHITLTTLNAYQDIIFGTERFDQNADFNNSTGVFTAPVTGRYLFTTSLYLFNSLDSAATYYYLNLETSNETVDVYFETGSFLNSDTNGFNMQASSIQDLSAGDTAKVKLYQSGGSAQTQIAGGHSHFSGALLC